MKKMNNKGFSLVELIVVVLIMAIIAVALAPQVMKWVENSRISADRQTYDDLISQIQIALTDKRAQALTATYTFTIGTSGTTCSDGTNTLATGNSDGLIQSMDAVNTSWGGGKRKYTGTGAADYVVTVTGSTKVITRGNQPDSIANSDLD